MWNIEGIASKGDYIYAVVPEHPKATAKGYVLLHRVVVENHLGRLLKDDEIVHHLNENKRDNGIENLQVMTRKEHTSLHAKPRVILELACSFCGILFPRSFHQRAEVKGYENAFCSRSCNGKYQRRKQLHAPVSPLASTQLKE